MANETYQVFALRYATVQRSSSENFLGGDPHETSTRMDYYVWLLRSPTRTLLVDTGFNENAARERKREFLRCPIESLSVLGISPHEIDEVILTHLHYDHAGNHDLLPNARFYLQERELHYAVGPSMRHAVLRHPYAVDDIVDVVRALYEERIVCLNGRTELAPGVIVHQVGGHTAGLQIVQVWTRKGWLVLSSDASHYYANYEQARPFPIVHNVAEMLDAYDTMRGLAASPDLVIPGHDPLVMERFRAPFAAAQDIVVQLA
ncbi:N-acyl homoserine lactonase family protein (plasmid) [Marinobacter sp. M3C]|jgi:glyoxylase-like metal-dependent hydrolase (beta-lactamase superfamily II)|uniref:N-acyl homoserine lactonase family protein n=1 Tax=Marinobacter sp. M3C TaxID=2917715 RepID=UPI00200E192E|nr:N-acyl homoserine lactonase family protein [Marinobacter sp. M3C]UQG62631.1 N-acyl homoserine lactonase family protein [Marinobacter sp. M3C]